MTRRGSLRIHDPAHIYMANLGLPADRHETHPFAANLGPLVIDTGTRHQIGLAEIVGQPRGGTDGRFTDTTTGTNRP